MSDPIVSRPASLPSDNTSWREESDTASTGSESSGGSYLGPRRIAHVPSGQITLDLLDKAIRRGGPFLKGRRDTLTGRVKIYGSPNDQGSDLFFGLPGGHSSHHKRDLAKRALRDALVHDYSPEVADHVMQHVETVLNNRPERTVWQKLLGSGQTKFHIDGDLLKEARRVADSKAQALARQQEIGSDSDGSSAAENAMQLLRDDLAERFDNQLAYPIADRVIAHIEATFGSAPQPLHGQSAGPTAEADLESRAHQIYTEANRKARELANLALRNRAAGDAFFGGDAADKRALLDHLIGAAWSDTLAAQLGGREDFQNARGVRDGIETAVRAAFARSDLPVDAMNRTQRMTLASQAVQAHLSQLAAGAPQRSAANLAVAQDFLDKHSVIAMAAAAQHSDAQGANGSGALGGPGGVSVPAQRGLSAQEIIEWAFARHPADLTLMPDQEKWDLAVDALEAYLARQSGAAAQ